MIAAFLREIDDEDEAVRPSEEVTASVNRYSTPSTVEYNAPAAIDAVIPEAMARGLPSASAQAAPDESEHFQSYERVVVEESGSKLIVASVEREMGTVALVAPLAPVKAHARSLLPISKETAALER